MSSRTIIGLLIFILIILGIVFYLEKKPKTPEEQPPIPTAPEASEEKFPGEGEITSSAISSPKEEEGKKEVAANGLEPLLPPLVSGRIVVPQMDPAQAAYLKEPIILLQHSHFKLDPHYIPKSVGSGTQYFYIQLEMPLDKDKKYQLEQLGVELTEYIPHQTWIFSISRSRELTQLKKLSFVKAMGEIDPRDKIQPELLRGGFHSYATSPEGMPIVVVSLRSAEARSTILKVIQQGKGVVVPGKQPSDQFMLKASPELIAQLAGRPEVRWIEEKSPPPTLYNREAAALSRVDQVETGLKLDGEGVVLGIWDGGPVQPHSDLNDRVMVMEGKEGKRKNGEEYAAVNLGHAMHVAGTMIGDGKGEPKARGMASKATLYSYDFYGVYDTNFLEVKEGILAHKIAASNHSYGLTVGWTGKDFIDNQSLFGKYTEKDANLDRVIFETGHLFIKAAGNHRSDKGEGHPADCSKDGAYDCIPGDGAMAKNVITVGAVNKNKGSSSFSSWGPADDGRIKPDLVAKGESILSTCPNYYCKKQGTSMATPVVTGAVALLLQQYRALFADLPTVPLVKALLIQAAEDLGGKGPDYETGWGLLDLANTPLLKKGIGSQFQPTFIAMEEKTFSFNVKETLEAIKVTTVWMDPPANPGAALALVYDFDTELLSPDGKRHLPWVKDGNQPMLFAKRGVNKVDPIEQIVVENPLEGVWKLKIKAPPNLLGKHSVAVVTNVPRSS